MDAVVDVSNVGHAYGDVTALEHIDISVCGGEIFGLIGPNGAGKTTLVRAMSGALAPDTGRVRIRGTRPAHASDATIGLLPQSFGPPDRLTGTEILRYYRGLYANGRPVDAILEDVGMTDDADRWYERLSGGQQRRICVGTALVNDPDILLLDEPTTGIDPRGRRRIHELLLELRDDGRTIVLTTHDMTEAEALADRVGLLADGRIVTTGAPGALIERHAGGTRLVIDPAGPVTNAQLDRIDRPIDRRKDRLILPEVEAEDVSGIVESFAAARIEYTRFVWEQPTLEDVYFGLLEEDA